MINPAARRGTRRSASSTACPDSMRTTSSITSMSHPARIGFRQIHLVARPSLQRVKRGGLVDMDHCIELLSQSRAEVVTETLALRAVNDPDGALEPFARGYFQKKKTL